MLLFYNSPVFINLFKQVAFDALFSEMYNEKFRKDLSGFIFKAHKTQKTLELYTY
jgi:hypothetical protein